jgi:hypothetical protein
MSPLVVLVEASQKPNKTNQTPNKPTRTNHKQEHLKNEANDVFKDLSSSDLIFGSSDPDHGAIGTAEMSYLGCRFVDVESDTAASSASITNV